MKHEKINKLAKTNYNSGRKNIIKLKKMVSPFFNIAQRLEILAVRFSFISSLYSRLFYKDMLEKEFALADMQEGAAVLHIGCGAYPYTALYLAEKGCLVDACDCSSEAIENAQKLVEGKNCSAKINLFARNGKVIDCSSYDAVWVSLNIYPKRRVILQALKKLKPEGKLIYRNNPLWVEKIFFKRSQVDLEETCSLKIKKAISNLGAESVIVNNKNIEASRCCI